MYRGKRQTALDEYLLVVLGHLPEVFAEATPRHSGWFLADEVDEWAIEWVDEQDKSFTDWFDGLGEASRLEAIEKSLDRLVSLGLANRRFVGEDRLVGYRKCDILETLAKIGE